MYKFPSIFTVIKDVIEWKERPTGWDLVEYLFYLPFNYIVNWIIYLKILKETDDGCN